MFSIFSSEFPAAVHGASEDHAIPGGNSTAELVKFRETNIGVTGYLSHKITMFFRHFLQCEYLYTHDFNGGWSW